MDPFRYAWADSETQKQKLIDILRSEDWMMRALTALQNAALPQGWIVAGALYNLVWNHLTNRPSTYGLQDIDVFYFDADDLSWEAEDRVIQHISPLFKDMPVRVEIRNQARVHLWFAEKFGFDIPPITSSKDSIHRFSSVVHCLAARLDDCGEIEIFSPHGLTDLFSLKMRPNQVYNDNAEAYTAKAERVRATWPEVKIEPW